MLTTMQSLITSSLPHISRQVVCTAKHSRCCYVTTTICCSSLSTTATTTTASSSSSSSSQHDPPYEKPQSVEHWEQLATKELSKSSKTVDSLRTEQVTPVRIGTNIFFFILILTSSQCMVPLSPLSLERWIANKWKISHCILMLTLEYSSKNQYYRRG